MSSDAVKKVTESKSKTSEDKTPSKTDASSDSTSSEKSSSDSTSSEKTKSNKNVSSARPISYFSSVSTDEYRSGWNAIFSNSKDSTKVSNKKSLKRTTSLNAPRFITLYDSDLDEELTDLLLAAARKRAKKDKISIGRRLSKSKLKWRLECEIRK